MLLLFAVLVLFLAAGDAQTKRKSYLHGFLPVPPKERRRGQSVGERRRSIDEGDENSKGKKNPFSSSSRNPFLEQILKRRAREHKLKKKSRSRDDGSVLQRVRRIAGSSLSRRSGRGSGPSTKVRLSAIRALRKALKRCVSEATRIEQKACRRGARRLYRDKVPSSRSSGRDKRKRDRPSRKRRRSGKRGEGMKGSSVRAKGTKSRSKSSSRASGESSALRRALRACGQESSEIEKKACRRGARKALRNKLQRRRDRRRSRRSRRTRHHRRGQHKSKGGKSKGEDTIVNHIRKILREHRKKLRGLTEGGSKKNKKRSRKSESSSDDNGVKVRNLVRMKVSDGGEKLERSDKRKKKTKRSSKKKIRSLRRALRRCKKLTTAADRKACRSRARRGRYLRSKPSRSLRRNLARCSRKKSSKKRNSCRRKTRRAEQRRRNRLRRALRRCAKKKTAKKRKTCRRKVKRANRRRRRDGRSRNKRGSKRSVLLRSLRGRVRRVLRLLPKKLRRRELKKRAKEDKKLARIFARAKKCKSIRCFHSLSRRERKLRREIRAARKTRFRRYRRAVLGRRRDVRKVLKGRKGRRETGKRRGSKDTRRRVRILKQLFRSVARSSTLKEMCKALHSRRRKCRSRNCRVHFTLLIHRHCSAECDRVRRSLSACPETSALCLRKVLRRMRHKSCHVLGIDSKKVRRSKKVCVFLFLWKFVLFCNVLLSR
jgi:hypothetical protein